jgi:myo-inositol-1(or 4)-monophosphatase
MARKKAAATKSAAPKQRSAKKKSSAKKKAAQGKQTVKKKTAPKKKTTVKTAAKSADRKKKVPAKNADAAKTRSRGKVVPRQFLLELARAIRDAVLPMVEEVKGREVVSTATSGDVTFEIDMTAEKALLSHLRNTRAAVAYYSEDAGYSTFSNVQPKNLLIVDPIDGTRAAKSGFEGCVIAIASTRVIERPTLADVDNACVIEILRDRVYFAERGKGARMYFDGGLKRPRLSGNTDLETLTWSMTVPARPAELIFPAAANLIDISSLKGGFFACNSTSWSLTRLLTNQLDACVDIGGRFLRDMPEIVKDHFINAGRGNLIGIAPYDMAASLLIAEEAGCTVTDAYGKGFGDVLLLDSSPANHQTMIAAANPDLHQKLMRYFDTRIPQYEKLLKRHNRS